MSRIFSVPLEKASSATDQEDLHFYVGSNFHRPTSETVSGGGQTYVMQQSVF